MSSLLDAALDGERPDLFEVPTADLKAVIALVETARGQLDVLQIAVGAELLSRGIDERVIARDLKAATAPAGGGDEGVAIVTGGPRRVR